VMVEMASDHLRSRRGDLAKLMLLSGAADEKKVSTRIGGRPLMPPGRDWPRCAQHGEPMLFIAQIRLPDVGDSRLPGRLLLIFQCDVEPGLCESWDPDAGANAALLVPFVGLVVKANAFALLEVDDDRKPVDQHMAADGLQDVFGIDVDIRSGPGRVRHGQLL